MWCDWMDGRKKKQHTHIEIEQEKKEKTIQTTEKKTLWTQKRKEGLQENQVTWMKQIWGRNAMKTGAHNNTTHMG